MSDSVQSTIMGVSILQLSLGKGSLEFSGETDLLI